VALSITAVVLWRSGSQTPVVAKPRPSASSPAKLTVPQIYAALLPSVVSIESKGQGTGTGVIANADGAILTAFHVVNGAEAIEVIFADGTRSAAIVAGADPSIDIAILTAETLPAVVVPAVLGGRTAVGDEVVAIGDPLGLTKTTTAGVISGLDRAIKGEGGELKGLIQFDAAVNPGSSGGPLLNSKGQTVGIVVAIANPTEARTFIGIGFAVPIGAAVGAGQDQRPQL
jgi:S1-C subfamily serine protease